MNKQLKQEIDWYKEETAGLDGYYVDPNITKDFVASGEFSFSSPLTQEDYDRIMDTDLKCTYAVTFNMPKGGRARFIREENVNEFIEQVITALQDINHALWEIDIPSPTVPEYIEHHEQVQRVMKLVEEKLDAIREDAKRMEDDLK